MLPDYGRKRENAHAAAYHGHVLCVAQVETVAQRKKNGELFARLLLRNEVRTLTLELIAKSYVVALRRAYAERPFERLGGIAHREVGKLPASYFSDGLRQSERYRPYAFGDLSVFYYSCK